MQALLPIVYTLLFILLIFKMKFFSIPELSHTSIAAVFILKILAGLFLIWVYSHYYPTSDSDSFFSDSKVMYDVLWQHPAHFFKMITGIDGNDPALTNYYAEMKTWNAAFEKIIYNDSRTLVRLNAFFRILSFGNFYVHMVFMCFLSLAGLTALYKTFITYFRDRKKLLFIAIFLLPGVLFWSSGVLKEGLLIFGMGTLLYLTNCGLATHYTLKKTGLILLSVFLLLQIKFYVLFALLPGLMVNVWISKTSKRSLFVKYMATLILLAFTSFIISMLKPEYNLLNIIANKHEKSAAASQGGLFLLSDSHFVRVDYDSRNAFLIPYKENYFRIKPNSSYDAWTIDNLRDTLHIVNSTDTALFKLMYSVEPPKSKIPVIALKPTFFSFIANAPIAFFNVLITPFSFDRKDALKILASLENLFYLCCILLMAFCFKRPNDLPVFYFCLTTVIFIFVLIGLTTPVMGSIVRYKVPALPFLMIFVFMLMDKNKLKKIPLIGKYLID